MLRFGGAAAASIAAAALLVACAPADEEGGSPAPGAGSRTEPTATSGLLHWTLREGIGWTGEDGLEITFRIDGEGGPLPASDLARAFDVARRGWEAAGPLRFRPAPSGAAADLVLRWGGGEERPFRSHFDELGRSGPPASPTYIEIDPRRPWRVDDAGAGFSLTILLAHELGHVLGLDHSTDPRALLHASYEGRPTQPAESDRAGLRALLQGRVAAFSVEPAPGDLVLEREPGAGADLVLPGLARAGRAGAALVDLDGDGRCEVLVWPREGPGRGSWTAYGVAEGSRLGASSGPALAPLDLDLGGGFGVVEDGVTVGLVRGAGRRYAALIFDAESPWGRPWPLGAPLALRDGFKDLEGDGVYEEPGAPGLPTRGDADGDGRPEVLRVID